jgi:hypothetical protein
VRVPLTREPAAFGTPGQSAAPGAEHGSGAQDGGVTGSMPRSTARRASSAVELTSSF